MAYGSEQSATGRPAAPHRSALLTDCQGGLNVMSMMRRQGRLGLVFSLFTALALTLGSGTDTSAAADAAADAPAGSLWFDNTPSP